MDAGEMVLTRAQMDSDRLKCPVQPECSAWGMFSRHQLSEGLQPPGRFQPALTTPRCPGVLGLSQASPESGALLPAPPDQQGGQVGAQLRVGEPHLPLDEPVNHTAILIETPHLEGLV